MKLLQWRPVQVGPVTIHTSVTDAETAKLRELAHGRKVLEIGSAYGYSAIVMALAGAQHVLAIDPHNEIPGSLEQMQRNLDACDVVDEVSIVASKSDIAMPNSQMMSFGLVFVDGDHAEHWVAHDARAGWHLLEPGGWLACHDYDEETCPGPRAALDRLFGAPPDLLVDTLWCKQKPA